MELKVVAVWLLSGSFCSTPESITWSWKGVGELDVYNGQTSLWESITWSWKIGITGRVNKEIGWGESITWSWKRWSTFMSPYHSLDRIHYMELKDIGSIKNGRGDYDDWIHYMELKDPTPVNRGWTITGKESITWSWKTSLASASALSISASVWIHYMELKEVLLSYIL